jgi:hypothetical protein
LSTGATFLLLVGFALLLSGFVVVAVPARFQDDRSGRRTIAGGYGLQPAPVRSQVLVRGLAGVALVLGTILVIGTQLFGW